MAGSERAQWARLDIDGVALLADLAAGACLARPVEFDTPALRCFGAAPPASVPLQAGQFIGAVAQGGSCNCSVVTFTPHANGTHTECTGHLTVEPLDAHRVVPTRLLVAVVLTVDPAQDGADGAQRPITPESLQSAWPAPLAERLRARAAVIRTLPNAPDKYQVPGGAVPYLSAAAATELVGRGILHLVLDLPSADPLDDDGMLTAHRIFFGLPAGSRALRDAQRRECTITELAYVDAAIADGWYLLSLQTAAIAGDAVASRPLLYALRTP